ncbi:efflux RND transporter periplasmic adaptor subunit [Candidatus Nucleicultrix amoebiphila]|jgi:RND family efflux transporter MFP subunit|uniref:Multidrug resistance protein MdtA-like C-terminal permuted SH3 domain-containing protein n=1 Tax=Candidatus Nucleicultrix amoebiphila FS5 TaxID=1414854 RepID=A0A1W6N2J7_9PROT|nr:efflux RND transporter periplasmic adaptor subunit [Candidatus Nucleicultrix amoebiphila]ARN84029.1 hypothetical protein GQ61_00185 [Candidatus Nucleicultrix amoebiphila FS5]
MNKVNPLFIGISLTLILNTYVFGHGDEAHEDAKPLPQIASTSSETLPSDLSLLQRAFIPKEDQFKNHLTTFLTSETERPRYEILPAKVIASPNGYAQIHVAQASRVVADPAYPMPNTGDKVEANQVIAVVEPLVTSLDITDKRTELYKIEGEIAELEREVKRLITLGDFSPRVKLEDAKTNLERAKKQKQQILKTGLGRELIKTPITGIVSDAHILPGQVIPVGQYLAEIVNPSSLRIEAYTYDYALAGQIKEASLRSPEDLSQLLTLSLIGLSPRVGDNDQARHILFSLNESSPSLMIGMFVDVIASLPSLNKKITVPKKALFKTGQNYSVFTLEEPELVIARPVQVGVFFEDRVEILEGLKVGERVIEDIMSLAKTLKKEDSL